ncbi:MAG: type II toxin-antitoxin system HicA family toxin [Thermodesulfovibrio sp.]|nr:type II toxin-antitoxin system HicA family toxin [Thermodesulfovibrio sp.]
MSKLIPAKPEEVIRILEKLGFKKIRQSGSHAVFYHSDGRWTTVPIHKGKDVAKGTLRKILRDIGLTYEEFRNMK